jgi:hypothetical protein
MRQTVVATFDRYAEAKQAANLLRDSGFRDSVYVTDEVGGSDTAAPAPAEPDTGVFAQVRQFFSGLFGNDDEKEAIPYAEAVRRGGAIVKVEVDADEDVERACETLESAGAMDIDERASEWKASGWNEGTSLRREEPSLGDETEPATPAMPAAAVRRGGVRIYANPVVSPAQGSVEAVTPSEWRTENLSDAARDTQADVGQLPEDAAVRTPTDYRSHFDENFASGGGQWDEFEPAYHYGEAARSDARYQGRQWDEIEPQMRGGWESLEPGTWERFKAAVRHAWERIKS